MRTIVLSLLLVSFSPITSSANWLYNRLEKKYQEDIHACLELAKKYERYFKNSPAPNYFASKVYYDKSLLSRNERGAYLQLYRAVSHAKKCQLKQEEKHVIKEAFQQHLILIEQRAKVIIHQLDKYNQSESSQKLITHLNTLRPKDVATEESTPLSTKKPNATVGNTVKRLELEGQFYGLSNGSEIISSFNIEEEKQLFELINKERIQKNLPVLIWSTELSNAARYHAYDMGTQNYFSHSSKDRYGKQLETVAQPFDRMRTFFPHDALLSENIAAGSNHAPGTFKQWNSSKSHHKIMFNPNAKHVGIGFIQSPDSEYEYYWVLCTAE